MLYEKWCTLRLSAWLHLLSYRLARAMTVFHFRSLMTLCLRIHLKLSFKKICYHKRGHLYGVCSRRFTSVGCSFAGSLWSRLDFDPRMADHLTTIRKKTMFSAKKTRTKLSESFESFNKLNIYCFFLFLQFKTVHSSYHGVRVSTMQHNI